jgi:hypothetical protein
VLSADVHHAICSAGLAHWLLFAPVDLHSYIQGHRHSIAMDPLSITCSIIAIIGAGQGVAKTIRKLARVKGAPLSVLQLNNEVSDLSLAVRAIEEFHQDGRTLPPASIGHGYITTALEEAKDAVVELEVYITEKLSKINTKKLDRLAWMRAEPTIVLMKERVRSAKLNLVAATNVLTWYGQHFV